MASNKNPIKKSVRQKLERLNMEFLTFRFRPDQLTQKTIDRVCKYYMEGIQLADIVRKVNGPRPSLTTLNLADVYTILWHAVHTPQYTPIQVQQRKRYREWELCIEAFPRLVKAWRAGQTKKDMYLLGSPTAVNRVLHAMYLRCNAEADRMTIKVESSASEILKYAERRILDGQEAWIIFVNKLPQSLQSILRPISEEAEDIYLPDHPDLHALEDHALDDRQAAPVGSLCPEAVFDIEVVGDLKPFDDIPEDEKTDVECLDNVDVEITEEEDAIESNPEEPASPPQQVQKALEDLLS
jgi:hypothetical protein